ncbi:MAG: hypothetical protein U5R06_14935 [candidate division KSB1 bacterium]|nr:hypothetical protein [candidate division KSB1 bacterium]
MVQPYIVRWLALSLSAPINIILFPTTDENSSHPRAVVWHYSNDVFSHHSRTIYTNAHVLPQPQDTKEEGVAEDRQANGRPALFSRTVNRLSRVFGRWVVCSAARMLLVAFLDAGLVSRCPPLVVLYYWQNFQGRAA